MVELIQLNQEKLILSWRTHCIWCCEPFGPHRGKSKEHLFPDSIGGSFKPPMLCVNCNNNKLGPIDAFLYEDYWINLGKSAISSFGIKGIKVNPSLPYDRRLEKMLEINLPDGKSKLVFPETPKNTYRAIAKISFTTIALGLGNLIFDPTFDNLRSFISRGEPDLAENGFATYGCAVCRTYSNRNWKPRHTVILEFDRPNLVITLVLFDSYHFLSFSRLDKDVEIQNYKIVQLLHPKKEAGFYLGMGKDKFEFKGSLDGIHI